MSWSEAALHRWLAGRPWPQGLAGSRGHDAAVLRAMEGHPVLCADQCIEGVHFAPGTDPRTVGAKAVLRTLSDLAATAARPLAVTLCVQAPAGREQGELEALLEGARSAARAHGAELVAGDLAAAEGPLALAVTAMGRWDGPGPPVGRDRAVPGQAIYLSGPVGGSLEGGRHLAPAPRFAAAAAAVQAGATAMMDVSDGLALDLSRLLEASAVAGELDLDAVPVHADAVGAAGGDPVGALQRALGEGEDHELIATASGPLPPPWRPVGRVLPGAGLTLVAREGGAAASLAGPWVRGPGGGWVHGDPPSPSGSVDATDHPGGPLVLELEDEDATLALGRALGQGAEPGCLITLRGELGAGKTTLVRGLGEGLGIEHGVSSPTYTLMQLHEGGRLPLAHFDAWMEGREKAFLADGADELLELEGVAVVEWAERVAEWLPPARLAVELTHAPGGTRRARLVPEGDEAWPGRLLAHVRRALGVS